MSREISLVVIHCSATPAGKSLFEPIPGKAWTKPPIEVIDGWHATRGFARTPEWRTRFNPLLRAIGYHWVIYTNGAKVPGRHVDEIGAHVQGHNKESLGVCLVGMDAFTGAQWSALDVLVTDLCARYPKARVVGHRDLSPDIDHDGIVEPREWLKTCPTFDVSAWLAGGKAPLKDHLYTGVCS